MSKLKIEKFNIVKNTRQHSELSKILMQLKSGEVLRLKTAVDFRDYSGARTMVFRKFATKKDGTDVLVYLRE